VPPPAIHAGCRTCGAPVEPDQEYCLECGTRLEPPRPSPGISAWIVPSLVSLVVATGGGAAAIASADESHGRAAAAITALSRLEPVRPPPKSETGSRRPGPRGRSARQGLISWPGTGGYTLILASLPVSGGPAAAKKQALGALRRGLDQVGVLVSSSYASLHPGYYVVFGGVYESDEEAQADLQAARRFFPSAYASPVVR
jgi:hypothetical protein